MNVSCEDIRNLALLCAFGEAAREDEARVREHAAVCAGCAAEIRALKEGIGVLEHAPREMPSRETREAIGGMLLREAPRRAAGRTGFRYAAAAAVLIAGVAGVFAWKSWKGGPADPDVNPTSPVAMLEEKAPEPELDPALAWNDGDLDNITASINSLAPASAEPKDPDLDWFEEDAAREDLADMNDRLYTIYTEIDKL